MSYKTRPKERKKFLGDPPGAASIPFSIFYFFGIAYLKLSAILGGICILLSFISRIIVPEAKRYVGKKVAGLDGRARRRMLTKMKERGKRCLAIVRSLIAWGREVPCIVRILLCRGEIASPTLFEGHGSEQGGETIYSLTSYMIQGYHHDIGEIL